MASVATHFSAFLLLLPIGLRRLHSSSSLYLHNPSHFRSKLWYFSEPKWKNLDLYALLISLPIASFSELFLFLSFSAAGNHPTYRFSFFHQSFLLSSFWLLVLLIALNEHYAASFISDSLVFLFAGVLFLMEYSVADQGVSGLAGVFYGFSGGLTLICAGACVYLSVKPTAFFAEFLLSSGMVFKATWILQSGFSLYTDAFGMKGCGKIGSASLLNAKEDAVDVHCDLEEDKLRGFAMVHLLFTVHAIVVMVVTVGLFGALASNRGLRCGEARGPLLSEIDSASASRLRPLTEVEMD